VDRIELFKIVVNDIEQWRDPLQGNPDFQHVSLDPQALQLPRAVPVEAACDRRGIGIEGRRASCVPGPIFGNMSGQRGDCL